MLSRRRFLASLAASVALRPAIASAASDPQQCAPIPPADQPWSYAQAHTLAVRHEHLCARAAAAAASVDGTAAARLSTPPSWARRCGSDSLRCASTSSSSTTPGTAPIHGATGTSGSGCRRSTSPQARCPALGPYDSRDAAGHRTARALDAGCRRRRDQPELVGTGQLRRSARAARHGRDARPRAQGDVPSRAVRQAADRSSMRPTSRYLLTEYGEKRRWDCLLMLDDADGVEGPVFKSFATILPPQGTDCHGRTFPVDLYRPDSVVAAADGHRARDVPPRLRSDPAAGRLERARSRARRRLRRDGDLRQLRAARAVAGHRHRLPRFRSRVLVQHQRRLRRHRAAERPARVVLSPAQLRAAGGAGLVNRAGPRESRGDWRSGASTSRCAPR